MASRPASTNDSEVIDASAWLVAHRAELTTRRNRWRRSELVWSWGRVVTFFAFFAPLFVFSDRAVLGASSMAVCAGLFVWILRHHGVIQAHRELADLRLLIIEETGLRFGGQPTVIRGNFRPEGPADAGMGLEPILDDGPTCALTDQERDDLDLFGGPISLFGLLNRTSTAAGARRLADVLDHPCLSADHIRSRQAAVDWLARHPAERIETMAATAALRERDAELDKLVAAIRQAAPLPWRVRSWLLRGWSIPSGALVLWAIGRWFYGGAGDLLGPAASVVAINSILFLRMRSVLSAALAPWRSLGPVVTGYGQAAARAADDLPTESALGRLRERFAAATVPSLLPVLVRRLPWVDTRGFVHAMLNVLVFHDLHVAEAVLKRVCPHRETLLAGLSALADLEMLAGLACFAWEQPVTCRPEPVDEERIRIAGGRHPFIPPDRVVANDLALTPTEQMWIITGSNMAGKSTFIRMVGVNVLLAQLGTTAVADEMTWCPVRLITDLRARDSLSREESYFLAEVRQLRRMVLAAKDTAPLLGLIDEPFRGTNSEEQVAASLAVVQHLLEASDFVILATHERRLTDLADGTVATNHHFRELLDADGLVFDYTIQSGPAQTRNALRVLEREGYPERLLGRAQAWLEEEQGTDG